MDKTKVFIWIIFFSLFSIAAAVSFKLMDPRIEAATAFYPYTQELVENVYGKSFSNLSMVPTSQAFEDLVNDKVDVIIVTEPNDEQLKLLEDKDLVYRELFLEPLIIYVNKENDLDNLSIDLLKKIYYAGTELNTYQLKRGSGSQTSFETIVKNNRIGNNHYEVDYMDEIIDKVAEDKNGIAYAFSSFYFKQHCIDGIKIISINNKKFDEEDYPLQFKVYLIYDETNQKVSKLIKYLDKGE